MDLTAVFFSRSATGALTLRPTPTASPVTHDWNRPRGQANAKQFPIAYPLNTVGPVTVALRLETSLQSTVHIRTKPVVSSLPSSALLGQAAEQSINLASGQNAEGLYDVTLTNPRIANAAVGEHTVSLSWEWKPAATSAWNPLATTTHTVYAVLGAPRPPWGQPATTALDGRLQLPWSRALRVATSWAAGARTSEEAVVRIVTKLHELGGKEVTYRRRRNKIRYHCCPN